VEYIGSSGFKPNWPLVAAGSYIMSKRSRDMRKYLRKRVEDSDRHPGIQYSHTVELFHSHLRELLPPAPKAGPRYRFTLWPAAGTPCPIQTRCASLTCLRPYAVSKSLIVCTLA